MGQLLDTIKEFLYQDAWDYQQQSDPDAVQMRFRGDTFEWTCFARVNEDDQQAFFYSVAPFHVPAEKRRDIAEAITRLNYGLPIGNFEMDFADGEIRYRTSIDVEGSKLDIALVETLLHANVQSMNAYIAELHGVVEGRIAPADIL